MKPLLALAALMPSMAAADFTENNLLAIFYHELGHAVIHQMDVPIFGQEEDAADALSILLIDALYDNESAEAMAYDSATLFWVDSAEAPAFWGVHGPDEQRYYNTVCLFYGADPDTRGDFAEDNGLPEERADGCADEFDLAASSWNAVLNEMDSAVLPGRLVIADEAAMPLIVQEVAALNEEFGWPRDIAVTVEACGEANAFYDLDAAAITMCSELEDWLRGIQADLGL